MTEVVEYSLVVLTSTLLIAGSAYTYGSFLSFENSIQARGTLTSLAMLANDAIQNGSSTGQVQSASASVTCMGGVLTVSQGTATVSKAISSGCMFSEHLVSGTHLVTFSSGPTGLAMAVS